MIKIQPVLVTDIREVRLPDHETAVRNLDLSNLRLRIDRERVIEKSERESNG